MKTHLLMDRRMIQPQGICNAVLRVMPLCKDRKHGVLLEEEFFSDPPKRWEVRYDNGYPNIIYDPEQEVYHCYYTLFYHDPDSAAAPKAVRPSRRYEPSAGRRVGLAYARSRDGIHWEKPALGKVLFEGSRDNNLLFLSAHGTGVMLDAWETDPERRYKLVTKMDFPDGRQGEMAVNFSPDGVHWGEMRPWPEHVLQADSHNFPYYDIYTGTYRMLTRCWRDGVRVVVSCESKDFLHWSAPKEVLRGKGFGHQVYAMPVFLCRGLYLGLAAVFRAGDREDPDFDTIDCQLYYAVTPDVFDVVSETGEPFIPRGEGVYPAGDFDCGCIFASPPVEVGSRLYFYYMGGNGRHTGYRETSLSRGWIEKDRFACYAQRNPDQEGILSSAQLTAEGEDLFLLADTSDGGWIRVCLREKWNGPDLEGFSEEDCRLEETEKGTYRLHFARPLASLAGCRFCMVLRFSRARLYAIAGNVEKDGTRFWDGVQQL